MRLAALRRALLPAVVAAAALASIAPAAGAQPFTATAAYAPSCGPGTACSLVRFTFSNGGSSTLLLNSLALTSTSDPFRFAASPGGVALYEAVDAVGPFGGSGTVMPGGAQVFIDFLGSNGFAFQLDPSTSGYVELTLTARPVTAGGQFGFLAELDGDGNVSGTVTPEPATLALVGGGLALLGVAARRRRRA